MPNPLLFLVAVVVIDLILKSAKTKKNREHVKKTSMEQPKDKAPVSPTKTSTNKSIRELRMMLEEELGQGKRIKQDVEKTIDTTEKRKTRDDLIDDQRKKIDKHSELAKMKRKINEIESEKENFENRYSAPVKQVLTPKTHEEKNKFRQDLVKGIIFSEILGKPKSMRK